MRQPIYRDPGFSERAVEMLKALGLLNWNVVEIGVHCRWLPRKVASEFAAECLRVCDEGHRDDLEWLAQFGEQLIHDIGPLLKSLAEKDERSEQRAIEAWRLVFIKSTLATEDSWDEKTDSLFLISSMFNDPDDMRALRKYTGPILDEYGNDVDPLDAATHLAEKLTADLTSEEGE